MSRMTGPHLTYIRTRHLAAARIKVFVETGTFRGKTTRLAVAQFPVVHTIELNPDWYADAHRSLGPLGVQCHLGDTREILPKLAQEIQEPAFWYLDAHWFSLVPNVAGRDRPLPLWEEIDALKARPYPDVIVVDDVRAFETSNPCPEWLTVSLARIADCFPNHKEALVMQDQAVVYR